MESRSVKKKIPFLIILIGAISILLCHSAKAAPPDSPYLPGETLDPNCSPGETNCTVVPPVLSTRLISTTLPLSGGGDLSEDRVLKIPGLSSLGTPNFLVGVNLSGSGWEYKELLAVPNQISISYSTGSILLSLPQDIHPTASPIFSTLTLTAATSSTIFTINQTGTGDIISIQQSGVPIFSIPSSGAVNISAGTASTWKTLSGNLTIQSAGNLSQSFATTSQYTLTQGTTPRFSIDSSGNLSLAGTSITLSGDTLIQGSATTTGNLIVQGETQLSTTTIGGKFTISAPTQITGGLTFDTATSTGAFTVQGSFTQTGPDQVTFSGNVDATAGLDVSGGVLTTADGFTVSGGATNIGGTGVTINVATSGTALTVTQSNTGAIAEFSNTSSATSTALTLTNLGTGNTLLIEDEESDTTPFVIDENGNVGIGTTNPGQKLSIRNFLFLNITME